METGLAGRGTVAVIEDDPSVRTALFWLLRSLDFEVEQFSCAEEFLQAPDSDPECLIVDMGMPAMSGLDLQQDLMAGGRKLPIIFISGRDDAGARAGAIKAGAVAFLRKPFTENLLLDALRNALPAPTTTRTVRPTET
jgi:FixJ family two-component response regulator